MTVSGENLRFFSLFRQLQNNDYLSKAALEMRGKDKIPLLFCVPMPSEFPLTNLYNLAVPPTFLISLLQATFTSEQPSIDPSKDELPTSRALWHLEQPHIS